ncbi:hypothetical protein FACS189490_04920 [Clostridia bacterium]|nr:hypothetical protein FACS189490_04920 [Clostridia bacterium]
MKFKKLAAMVIGAAMAMSLFSATAVLAAGFAFVDTSTTISKTYGDPAFTNKAEGNATGTVTYVSTNTTVATVDAQGTVTIRNVGNTRITATAPNEPQIGYNIVVNPKEISIDRANVSEKIYDGTTGAAVTSVTFLNVVSGAVPTLGTGYKIVSAVFDDTLVGQNKLVNIKISLEDGRYELVGSDTITARANIVKATEPAITQELTGTIGLDAGGTTFNYTIATILGAQYSKDGTNWQDTGVFTGLEPSKSVTFYARIKAQNETNYNPGPAKTKTVAFGLLTQGKPALSYTITGKVVEIDAVPGAQYKFDNGSWSNTNNTKTYTTETTATLSIYFPAKTGSAASEVNTLVISLAKDPQGAPAKPTLHETPHSTANNYTVEIRPDVTDYEYSFDGTNFTPQRANTFSPGVAVTGYIRLKATDTLNASPAVASDTLVLGQFGDTANVRKPTFSQSGATITIYPPSDAEGVYYTTDGTDPNGTKTLYTGPFTIGVTTLVRAVAYKTITPPPAAPAGPLEYSDIASQQFTPTGTTPPTGVIPSFSPNGGTYTNSLNVTINVPAGLSSVRYTTDGTDPLTGSTYTTLTSSKSIAVTPVTATQNIVLKAVGYKADGSGYTSVVTATFTPTSTVPVISPASGTPYSVNQVVTITVPAGLTHVYYTTNGTDPKLSTSNPTPLTSTGSFTVAGTMTGNIYIRAIGYNSVTNQYTSEVSATYYPNTSTVPIFSPASGTTFTNSLTVTIVAPAGSTGVFYTLDGTDPRYTYGYGYGYGYGDGYYYGDGYGTGIRTYTGPFNITATTTVRAASRNSSGQFTDVASAIYTNTAASNAPTFFPVSGTAFAASLSVSLYAPSGSTGIRYTTNGASPITSGINYTGPFTITASTNVLAVAYNSLTGQYSSVSSAIYTLGAGGYYPGTGGGTTSGTGTGTTIASGSDIGADINAEAAKGRNQGVSNGVVSVILTPSLVREYAIGNTQTFELSLTHTAGNTLLNSTYVLKATKGGAAIGRTNAPIKIDVDVTQLTAAEKAKLTGVWIEGSVTHQLGGELSTDGRTFTYYAYANNGSYGLRTSDNIFKMYLQVGRASYTANGLTGVNDVAPYIDAALGKTMVPLKLITEAIGAKVEWGFTDSNVVPKPIRVTMTLGSDKVTLTTGQPLPNGLGTPVIDVASGRTMVPLRYILENFGANVVYDDATKEISIYR